MCSVDVRTPLGTCFGLNTSVNNHNMLQSAWDRKQAREAQARHHEDARLIQVLENASFSRQCGWKNCKAVLGSWELLRKHMEKMHCEEVSLGQSSSSHPYRCYYANCHNRIFSYAPLLLEHIVSLHLDQLKLRCPFGCKQNLTNLQSLVRHLDSVHEMTPHELHSAQIRRPSLQQEPLPELPTHVPMYLLGTPRAMPAPSFDTSKALAAAQRADEPMDEWCDFADIDSPEASEMRPFERLGWPEPGAQRSRVRTIPRDFSEMDEDKAQEFNQKEIEDSEESEESPKVGYKYWKRRFEREENRQQRRNGSS